MLLSSALVADTPPPPFQKKERGALRLYCADVVAMLMHVIVVHVTFLKEIGKTELNCN